MWLPFTPALSFDSVLHVFLPAKHDTNVCKKTRPSWQRKSNMKRQRCHLMLSTTVQIQIGHRMVPKHARTHQPATASRRRDSSHCIAPPPLHVSLIGMLICRSTSLPDNQCCSPSGCLSIYRSIYPAVWHQWSVSYLSVGLSLFICLPFFCLSSFICL